ncbi:MAG TPA: branched-chain amino acid ABC transporter permease, partial [Aggregatilineales bacterium]|nr:branched-chain amino acid ABC transporter permease [Aggregatilineales bacterium]
MKELKSFRLLGQNPMLAAFGIALGLLIFSFLASNGDPGIFGITVLSGLFQGMLLFLVAAGLSIVFGLMGVLNFAQGSYFMIGAYASFAVFHEPGLAAIVPDENLRFVLAILVAIAVGAVLGALLERILLRPLYARPIFQIVMTFGVYIVIGEAIKTLYGTTANSWGLFDLTSASFTIFSQSFSIYRLIVIVAGLALVVGVALLLRRTRIGIIIRAGVEDSEMVEALGINVRIVFTLVFALGCAVAAFGGAIAAPFLGASPGLADQFLLAAIAVVALGGLGSYEGSAVGSVLVGLAVAVVASFATHYLNQPVWADITPMLLL